MSAPRFIEEKKEEYYSKPQFYKELAKFTNPAAGPSPKPALDIQDALEGLLQTMQVEKDTPEFSFILNTAKELFNKKYENQPPPPNLREELKASLGLAKELQLQIEILELKRKCDDLVNKLKLAPKEDVAKLENELKGNLEKLNKLSPALKNKDEQLKLNKDIDNYKKEMEEINNNPKEEISKEKQADPEIQKGRDYAGELKRALLSIGEPGERYVMEHVIKNYAGIVKQESQNANVENALEADTDEEYGQIPQQIDPNSPTDTETERKARSPFKTNPFDTSEGPGS